MGYFLYYMTSPAIIMSTCKVTSPAIMLYSLVVRWHQYSCTGCGRGSSRIVYGLQAPQRLDRAMF